MVCVTPNKGIDMDMADQSTELEELHLKVALSKHASYTIEAGSPGECEWCGEFSERIVRHACPRCRDKFKLDTRG